MSIHAWITRVVLDNTAMNKDKPDQDVPEPEPPLPPSKSQRKREATALQGLGEQLVKRTPAQLQRIPLPEDVLAAVRIAQTIVQRGGRTRQLQYIGKLMRRLDASEVAAIESVLATLSAPRRAFPMTRPMPPDAPPRSRS